MTDNTNEQRKKGQTIIHKITQHILSVWQDGYVNSDVERSFVGIFEEK